MVEIQAGLCWVRTNFLMDGVCWRYSNMEELQTSSWELYITEIIWFSPKCLKTSCKYFCNLVSRMGEDNKHYTIWKSLPSHKSVYNIYFNFCICLIKIERLGTSWHHIILSTIPKEQFWLWDLKLSLLQWIKVIVLF